MIPKGFAYIRTRTLQEAIYEYIRFESRDKHPVYYGGGTEIITLARLGHLYPDAVIDIKPIPATQVIAVDKGRLILGSGITLSEITDHPSMKSSFPLLQATVKEIADRTARNKITLGGNICGQIFYREAVLPFLVCDSTVRIVGREGGKERIIHQVFQRSAQLQSSELIVQMVTPPTPRTAPYVHIKRRKAGKVGYPIVTAVAIRMPEGIRIALSGVSPFPFRSLTLEGALQQKGVTQTRRIDEAIETIADSQILDDYEASRAYRLFVLRSVLEEILQRLGSE